MTFSGPTDHDALCRRLLDELLARHGDGEGLGECRQATVEITLQFFIGKQSLERCLILPVLDSGLPVVAGQITVE